MKQSQFTARYQRQWQQITLQLEALQQRKKKQIPIDNAFVHHYRELCQHLALAKERNYSLALINYLQDLVSQSHQYVYQRKSNLFSRMLAFIVADFPRAVRQEWRVLALSGLLFYGSFLICLLIFYNHPELINKILSNSEIANFRRMYSPDNSVLGEQAIRTQDQNFQMFGHYIFNNIGIAFRTFGGGLLWGIGSLFVLLFNGVLIGAVAGFLSAYETATPFWSFVIAHGAFELNGIVIAGAAGFKLGWALISPGGYSRFTALRLQAQKSIVLIWGAFFLLFIAAFVEAYWSSISLSSLSATSKYIIGGLLWVLVAAYFIWAGRRHAA